MAPAPCEDIFVTKSIHNPAVGCHSHDSKVENKLVGNLTVVSINRANHAVGQVFSREVDSTTTDESLEMPQTERESVDFGSLSMLGARPCCKSRVGGADPVFKFLLAYGDLNGVPSSPDLFGLSIFLHSNLHVIGIRLIASLLSENRHDLLVK